MIWGISLREYLNMGGPVMYPLMLVTLVLTYLLAERFMYHVSLRRRDITPEEVLALLGSGRSAGSTKTGICAQLLARLLHAKRNYGRLDALILDETVKGFLPELTRNFNMIACFVTVAPLLGLMGTVTGMITTFNVMNIFGTSNPKAMSAGISEALITTECGLVIAITGMCVQLFNDRNARQCTALVQELTRHIIRKFQL